MTRVPDRSAVCQISPSGDRATQWTRSPEAWNQIGTPRQQAHTAELELREIEARRRRQATSGQDKLRHLVREALAERKPDLLGLSDLVTKIVRRELASQAPAPAHRPSRCYHRPNATQYSLPTVRLSATGGEL